MSSTFKPAPRAAHGTVDGSASRSGDAVDADVQATLEALQVPLSDAEAHGLACGLLCTLSAGAAKSRWFTELLDAGGLAPDALAPRAAAVHRLDRWFDATRDALNSVELSFEPLLPDDEASLPARLDALAAFCAGFTYGVGVGGAGRGNAPLPADTREVVEDFQAIDGAERDAAVTESDVVELIEYVRVGVLVVLEDMRPTGAPKAPAGGTDEPLH